VSQIGLERPQLHKGVNAAFDIAFRVEGFPKGACYGVFFQEGTPQSRRPARLLQRTRSIR
jgi:hypothetical protein